MELSKTTTVSLQARLSVTNENQQQIHLFSE